MDSGFQILNCRFFDSETWIPDSLSCIPDFKAKDFGFQKQKFSGFHTVPLALQNS